MDAGANVPRSTADVRRPVKRDRCGLCGQRAGDRNCPTLGRLICSSCCGKERGRTVRCLPSCPYLVEAERRWRARRSQEFLEAWSAWQKAHPELPWPYLQILARVLAAILHETFGTDAEVERALVDLNQALSPLVFVSAAPSPLGKTLSSVFQKLVGEGKLEREPLREATQALGQWLSTWRLDQDNRRFVRALLGTFPPLPKEPDLILRP